MHGHLGPLGQATPLPTGTLSLVEEAERTLAPEPSLDLSTPPSASREEVGQAMSPVSGRPSKRWLWQQWVMERAPPSPAPLPGSQQHRRTGQAGEQSSPTSALLPTPRSPLRFSWQSLKLQFIELPGLRPRMRGCREGPSPAPRPSP